MNSRIKSILAINRIIEGMNLAGDYHACLQNVVGRLCRLFHVSRCSLMVLDKRKRLTIHAYQGMDPKIAQKVSIRVGEGIAGKIVRTGRPVLVKNIEKHQVFRKKSEKKYYTKSFLSAPLALGGRVIGVLNLNNKTDHTSFTGEDLKLLKPLLSHVAAMVKNALLISDLDLSNNALKKKVAMLNTLFYISQDVIRVSDLKDLFRQVLSKTIKLIEGDSGSLMLYNEDRSHLEIKSAIGLDRRQIAYSAEQSRKKSLAHWVASHGKPIMIIGSLRKYPEFSGLESFDKFKSILSVPLTVRESSPAPAAPSSSLSIPLNLNKKIIGVVNVNRKYGQTPFNRRDLQFLSVLSFQIAMAVENAQLVMREKKHLADLRATKAKLEEAMTNVNEELDMARHIQNTMLPKELPRMAGLELSARYIPSGVIGGDLYDAIRISDSRVALLIFDVAGHGLAAALVTAMAKMSFTKNIQAGGSPSEILWRVNQELISQLDEESYLTAFLAILDTRTRKMVFSKAGHPPALLLRAATGKIEKLETRGSFVGIFTGEEFCENTVELAQGDKVIFYTDGLIESLNPDLKRFNPEIISELLTGRFDKTTPELLALLTRSADDKDAPRSDDITLLACGVTG